MIAARSLLHGFSKPQHARSGQSHHSRLLVQLGHLRLADQSELFPDSVLARTARRHRVDGGLDAAGLGLGDLASCLVSILGLDLLHGTSRWSSEGR